MFRPIKWSSSGPSHRVTKSQKAAYTYGISLVFTSECVNKTLNANGIPYVYAAFCDFMTLCDGPDDDHLIGRNMLSM